MEVKWIKITTDMFDNRKIRHLRRLPEGNSIVLIWVMLLTMAGRCNAGGMIFLTENIPYTPKMLADELDFEENTVALALQALESLGMISRDPLSITNWEEYQNTEKMDRIREQGRLRKQKQRAIESASRTCHADVTLNVTQCHATDIEEDKDIEEEPTLPIPEGSTVESKVSRKKKDTFAKDSKPYLLAAFLGKRIHMRLPSTEPPDEKRLQSWADAIDKCNRIDGHPWDEIKLVLKFSQDDPFWQVNILSGKKFREKYVELLAKMTAGKSGQPPKPGQEASVDRLARLMREGAFEE